MWINTKNSLRDVICSQDQYYLVVLSYMYKYMSERGNVILYVEVDDI